MEVHPTALVDPSARLASGVVIGPFCSVGPQVGLGEGVVLRSHVVVEGDTEIGACTEVWPFAVLGAAPQDLKYAGEPTRLRIGARNRIREYVTMHRGTAGGGGETRIGDGGLYMTSVHIAHDCQVGDRVIVGTGAGFAGHVTVGDDVIVGGQAGLHQWIRVGRGAIVGAQALVNHDLIPYGLAAGAAASLDGLNLVGLRRRNTPREEVAALRRAFETLSQGEGSFVDRARALDAGGSALVAELVAFVTGPSERQFLTPSR